MKLDKKISGLLLTALLMGSVVTPVCAGQEVKKSAVQASASSKQDETVSVKSTARIYAGKAFTTLKQLPSDVKGLVWGLEGGFRDNARRRIAALLSGIVGAGLMFRMMLKDDKSAASEKLVIKSSALPEPEVILPDAQEVRLAAEQEAARVVAEREVAARRIQAVVRGHRGREEARLLAQEAARVVAEREAAAARRIQAVFRGHRVREEARAAEIVRYDAEMAQRRLSARVAPEAAARVVEARANANMRVNLDRAIRRAPQAGELELVVLHAVALARGAARSAAKIMFQCFANNQAAAEDCANRQLRMRLSDVSSWGRDIIHGRVDAVCGVYRQLKNPLFSASSAAAQRPAGVSDGWFLLKDDDSGEGCNEQQPSRRALLGK